MTGSSWTSDHKTYLSKADPGPARRVRAPPFWKKLRVCFSKFWLYNTHILWFQSINNVNIMYFIHYSCYKHIGYVWRGLKTNPRPKNSTAPGPRPPVLKFLDPLLIPFIYMYMVSYSSDPKWAKPLWFCLEQSSSICTLIVVDKTNNQVQVINLFLIHIKKTIVHV